MFASIRKAPRWNADPVPRAQGRALPPTSIDAAAEAVPSPARALQIRLQDELALEPAHAKWSPRMTLLFVVGSCGAFWAAVGLAVSTAAKF